jgi:molecular chaperone DnaJ
MINNLEEAYAELGLNPDASADEVKKAFRSLAKKYHPDTNKDNPDAETKFKRINRAKQIIDDPQKELKQSVPQDDDFGFNPFAGMMQQQRGPKRRPDPVSTIELTFEESILGCHKKVSYSRYNKCPECNGDCVIVGAVKCKKCNGIGMKSQRQGNMVFQTPCPVCQGSGREQHDCKKCSATGTLIEDITSELNIPCGIRNNQIINAGGGGNFMGVQRNPFTGQTADVYGHVILNMKVQADPDMNLDTSGQHVISTIQMTLLEALKGKSVKVRTVKGETTLKIRPKTKNGDAIVAKGYGCGGKGNHIFNVNVDYPEDVDGLIQYLEPKD